MATPGKKKFVVFPNHIAIVMDGNRRWAEQRGLAPVEGHRAGVTSLRTVVETLGKYGLPCLTVYSFSTENWSRPEAEVRGILQLFKQTLENETSTLQLNGIQLRHLGRLEKLPRQVRQALSKSLELTKSNRNMILNVALNYGGRAEIVDAIHRLLAAGVVRVNEKQVEQNLYTAGLPDVDLVIRTGGEHRLSNFLIWQSVYSELYFTDVLWPDFNAEEVDKALQFFSRKERRFGS